MKNSSVKMIRPHMDNIPQFPCPQNYRIRPYGAGEGSLWTAIQRAAEPFFSIEDSLFEREFGHALTALEDRSFFLETTTGTVVGTTTAWWDSKYKDGTWGLIHWVAIHPDYQGQGLAKTLMSAAMQRLQKSHNCAFLGTSTGRLAALKIYLDFGFLPDMEHENAAAAWAEVATRIDHPLLKLGA